jgi:heterodisulfide reductase subunit A/quinone-modifying oxidoreductase subunit QmoB
LIEKPNPKLGVFILDEQGRLSRFIDLAVLVQKLAKTRNIACCEVLRNPQSESILSSVREKFQAGQFDRVLWVGKFPLEQRKALESELYRASLNPYLHEWCDLEEQGIAGGERVLKTHKAMIIVQMAVARARLLEPLEPLQFAGEASVLIIGAGVAGLQAAVSFAKQGKKVHLVEKESGVGGKVASLRRLFPRSCDPHCGLDFAVRKLDQSPLVEIHTLARIKALEGGPGRFEIKIEKKPRYVNERLCHGCGECRTICQVIRQAKPMPFPAAYVIDRQQCPPDCRKCETVCPVQAIELDAQATEETVKAGAVLVTTGWDPYPLSQVEAYGYGRYPNVVSNLEMESLIEESAEIKTVGFIQCAGSRDEGHLSYCSAVCCTVTLKQVLRLKEKWPEARCYIFYQDIRTAGFDEALYQKVKTLDQVYFYRSNPATLRPTENGGLKVRIEDTLTGSEVSLELDLMVLAGGMVPARAAQEAAEVLKLPLNEAGFFESHAPCHPEESQRTGIRVGGACLGPMNIARSVESSHRAATDILPFLNETILVEPQIPVLNLAKCDKCKRCMEECSYSSFSFDSEGFPALDAARCRQCGSCMGACPLTAISMRHFTIPQIAAQIKAMKAFSIGKDEPTILAFLCRNDAYQAAKTAAEQNLPVPPNVIYLKVPCAGALNNALIVDALSSGIDGVLIGGCRDGECHYVKGNQLVKTRSVDLGDKLEKMFIEPARVRFEPLEIRDSRRYVEVIYSYVEALKRMGPNPFKN